VRSARGVLGAIPRASTAAGASGSGSVSPTCGACCGGADRTTPRCGGATALPSWTRRSCCGQATRLRSARSDHVRAAVRGRVLRGARLGGAALAVVGCGVASGASGVSGVTNWVGAAVRGWTRSPRGRIDGARPGSASTRPVRARVRVGASGASGAAGMSGGSSEGSAGGSSRVDGARNEGVRTAASSRCQRSSTLRSSADGTVPICEPISGGRSSSGVTNTVGDPGRVCGTVGVRGRLPRRVVGGVAGVAARAAGVGRALGVVDVGVVVVVGRTGARRKSTPRRWKRGAGSAGARPGREGGRWAPGRAELPGRADVPGRAGVVRRAVVPVGGRAVDAPGVGASTSGSGRSRNRPAGATRGVSTRPVGAAKGVSGVKVGELVGAGRAVRVSRTGARGSAVGAERASPDRGVSSTKVRDGRRDTGAGDVGGGPTSPGASRHGRRSGTNDRPRRGGADGAGSERRGVCGVGVSTAGSSTGTSRKVGGRATAAAGARRGAVGRVASVLGNRLGAEVGRARRSAVGASGGADTRGRLGAGVNTGPSRRKRGRSATGAGRDGVVCVGRPRGAAAGGRVRAVGRWVAVSVGASSIGAGRPGRAAAGRRG
jgi:hypothetical protein